MIDVAISHYYTHLTQMNPQGWLDTLADNAVIYDPVGKPPLNPQEDSQKFFRILTTFYETFEISQESLVVVGKEAAVKWTMKVIAKNGRQGMAEGISVFEVNDQGKITQIKAYWDEAHLKSQLMA